METLFSFKLLKRKGKLAPTEADITQEQIKNYLLYNCITDIEVNMFVLVF